MSLVKALTILIVFISLSCNSKKEEKLPQFATVREMLEDASDYYEENGSLKFISEDKSNFHIQVSKPIYQKDLENIKNEIVKRDIIYVAFQVFAQTSLSELTITSIPLDWENPKKYFNKYEKTVKINKITASKILKKYFDTSDFSVLYTNEGGVWLPNENFSKLKFEKLKEVFSEVLAK